MFSSESSGSVSAGVPSSEAATFMIGTAGRFEPDRRCAGRAQRDEGIVIFRGFGEGGACRVALRDQRGVVGFVSS